jgi:hypothetical protein
MYSITENIYYSQLSSVAILLQSEPVSHRVIQGKDWLLSPYVLSSCGLPLPPTCILVTDNEARSYFVSTILAKNPAFRCDCCSRNFSLLYFSTYVGLLFATTGGREPKEAGVLSRIKDTQCVCSLLCLGSLFGWEKTADFDNEKFLTVT